MNAFLYWSGVALWAAITVIVSVLLLEFVRQLFWAAIFVRRLLQAGGWRDDLPRWKRPWRFVAMTFREALNPTTYMVHQGTGQRIYHPLYKGAVRIDDED